LFQSKGGTSPFALGIFVFIIAGISVGMTFRKIRNGREAQFERAEQGDNEQPDCNDTVVAEQEKAGTLASLLVKP